MKYHFLQKLKANLYSFFVALYLLSLFIPYSFISYALGWIAIIILPLSFKGATRTFQWIAVIFVTTGLFIFTQSEFSWTTLPSHFTSTALLLSLLYFLPYINRMIVIGGYDLDLQNLLQFRTKHLGQLYYRTSLISYILCLFIFFSAITVVHNVLNQTTSDRDTKEVDKFASQAILRPFALANVWSPIEIFIALTVTITGVAYFDLLPWMLLFSLSLLILDWMINGFKYRKSIFITDNIDEPTQVRPLVKKISNLLGMLLAFILLAGIVEKGSELTYFNAVILLILPFTILWAIIQKQLLAFVKSSVKEWVPQTNGLQNLMLLFLSLGFFSEMFEQTSVIETLQAPFIQMVSMPLLLFLMIQLLSLGFSLIGIHPLVTISLMGTLIQPLLTEMNPVSLSIVLLTSTLASDAAGTFNTTVSIMSDLTKRNPYKITKWNIGFALWFGTVGSLLGWALL